MQQLNNLKNSEMNNPNLEWLKVPGYIKKNVKVPPTTCKDLSWLKIDGYKPQNTEATEGSQSNPATVSENSIIQKPLQVLKANYKLFLERNGNDDISRFAFCLFNL